jgi:type VI secretion system protein ImpF
MARFKPSLLDTLLSGAQATEDGAPLSPAAIPGVRLFSLDRVSESVFMDTVRRDLTWLMNTVYLQETLDLKAHPQTGASVLNFGIPDLSVRSFDAVDVFEASTQLRTSIGTFEPRVAAETLNVAGAKTKHDDGTVSLVFTVTCDVGPAAEAVRAAFQTRIDLETGNAALDRGS